MTRVLVLYYSSYGHVRALAEAEAEGARSVPGTHVDVRRVPETVPEDVRASAGFVADDAPVAAPADLEHYDAIILGTPTLFGMMAGQMKSFLDQAGGLWARNALVGKVAAVFTSTGSQHGGHEATLLSTQIPLQHFGMLIVGMPYTFAGQTTADNDHITFKEIVLRHEREHRRIGACEKRTQRRGLLYLLLTPREPLQG